MQAFVRSKHTQSRKSGTHSIAEIERLKVPVPDLGEPSQRSTRSEARQPLDLSIGAPQDARELRSHSHSHKEGRSKHGTSKPADGAVKDGLAMQTLTPDELADFENIDDFDAGFEVLSEEQLERLKQQKLFEIQQSRLIDKYIEGDSYPDTTSGQLTEIEVQPLQQMQQMHQMQPTPRAFATPLKRTRSSDRPKAAYGLATQVSQDDGQVQTPLFTRPDHAREEVSGFQMARRGQPHRKTAESIKHDSRSQALQPESMHQTHDPFTQNTERLPLAATSWTMQTTAPIPSPVPAVPVMTDTTEAAGDPKAVLQLDHDITALEHMQYEDLKHENFDLDPRAAPVDTAENVDLAILPAEQWAQHFQSLGLDKWEETGDWLIEQYAQVLCKLKNVRRKRREAARAFEQEIEERHKKVVAQRIVIRDAMEGMRTHGTQVLVKKGYQS